MKKILFIICEVVFLSIFIFPDEIPPIIIGTDPFPPYSIQNNSEEYTGLATDIIKEILNEMETPYKIEVYPWAKSLIMLKTGKIQALYTIGKTEEREKDFYFPDEPLCFSRWVFFIRKEDKGILKYNSLDDLKGKQIGLIRDYKYTPELWEFVNKHKNFYILPDEKTSFKLLASKRVDYIINDYITGTILSKELGLSESITALNEVPLEITPLYIAFSKSEYSEKVVKEFSTRLKIFKNSSRYSTLSNSYLDQ
ncbi:MAG: transporter substrate-binding domain-containing protein [Spirochaetaceae bacterium]